MCPICAGCDWETAKQNFYDGIKELKGEVLGKYIDAHNPVKCRCSEGHDCDPRPKYIGQGGGMCKTCSGKDSIIPEMNFRAKIKELGGEVIGKYIGSGDHIECRCPRGHICSPSPDYIKQGGGMCSSCGLKSEPLCRKIFEELLGTPFPKMRPKWLQWICPLELDGYNEEKKLAFEYQGVQHEKYDPHFHRNGPDDFKDQVDRDNFKAKKCEERGILLFIIPSTFNYKNPRKMREFISKCLIDAKLLKQSGSD